MTSRIDYIPLIQSIPLHLVRYAVILKLKVSLLQCVESDPLVEGNAQPCVLSTPSDSYLGKYEINDFDTCTQLEFKIAEQASYKCN